MTYYCPQCNFTSNFESALLMHQQLHHGGPCHDDYPVIDIPVLKEKSRTSLKPAPLVDKANTGIKLPGRTSSATRLFDRLRARIRRSRTLFAHPEETADVNIDLSVPSECTSKAFKEESPLLSKRSTLIVKDTVKETFGCHLCNFEADRITVLDRHLLNDHKIGMDNLLKLVMAKTKDGLSEDTANDIFNLHQPYYKPPDLEDGEFIIETVAPKIKILKHAATNTENIDLRDNCNMITNELEKLVNTPTDSCDKSELLVKMQTLNECMCKFVDSTNMLKRVLTKEFDTKSLRNERVGVPFFDLRLGDSPRDWERAHSERMERCRKKHGDNRGDKAKLGSESFYF